MKYVYVIGPVNGCYKIGHSNQIGTRLLSLNLPTETPVVATIATAHHGWLEKYLHTAFAHCRRRGEWFELDEGEVGLFAGLTRVESAADLPSTVVALHTANVAVRETQESENRLLPVKVPAWFHRKLKLHGVETGEDMGQIVVRLCDALLDQERAAVARKGA